MRSQRTFRLLTAGVLIAGASLAVTGLLAGSAPASLAATPAMLAEFEWTGADADDSFGTHCNWHLAPSCNFLSPRPDDTDDDATFPFNSYTPWAVDLIEETIRDLQIEEDVDFGAESGDPTLDVQKLRIDADAGETTITIGENAAITITNP